MFSWLRKAFGGEGTIRFAAYTDNNQYLEGTQKWEGDLSTQTEKEILADICANLYVQKGIRLNKIKILALVGESVDFPEITRNWYSYENKVVF